MTREAEAQVLAVRDDPLRDVGADVGCVDERHVAVGVELRAPRGPARSCGCRRSGRRSRRRRAASGRPPRPLSGWSPSAGRASFATPTGLTRTTKRRALGALVGVTLLLVDERQALPVVVRRRLVGDEVVELLDQTGSRQRTSDRREGVERRLAPSLLQYASCSRKPTRAAVGLLRGAWRSIFAHDAVAPRTGAAGADDEVAERRLARSPLRRPPDGR